MVSAPPPRSHRGSPGAASRRPESFVLTTVNVASGADCALVSPSARQARSTSVDRRPSIPRSRSPLPVTVQHPPYGSGSAKAMLRPQPLSQNSSAWTDGLVEAEPRSLHRRPRPPGPRVLRVPVRAALRAPPSDHPCCDRVSSRSAAPAPVKRSASPRLASRRCEDRDVLEHERQRPLVALRRAVRGARRRTARASSKVALGAREDAQIVLGQRDHPRVADLAPQPQALLLASATLLDAAHSLQHDAEVHLRDRDPRGVAGLDTDGASPSSCRLQERS